MADRTVLVSSLLTLALFTASVLSDRRSSTAFADRYLRAPAPLPPPKYIPGGTPLQVGSLPRWYWEKDDPPALPKVDEPWGPSRYNWYSQ